MSAEVQESGKKKGNSKQKKHTDFMNTSVFIPIKCKKDF